MKQLILGFLAVGILFPVSSVHAANSSRLTLPVGTHASMVVETKGGKDAQTLLISDALDSTKVVLNSDGSTTSTPIYYPYGAERESLTGSLNSRYYTGQRKISEDTLYNFNTRYYSPDLGIFTQPNSAPDMNRFAFQHDNPIFLVSMPQTLQTKTTAKENVSNISNINTAFSGNPRLTNDAQKDREDDGQSEQLFAEAFFKAGEYGVWRSGLSWSSRFMPKKSATLSFNAQFSQDFDFGRGGKLHGLCNGPCPMGGAQTGESGMSARFMWGPGGDMFLYLYDSDKPSIQQYGQYIPLIENAPELQAQSGGYFRNTDTGKSFFAGYAQRYQEAGNPFNGYSIITAQRGMWQDYRMMVSLNDPGKRNGAISAYLNGNRVLNITGFDFIKNGQLNNTTMLQKLLFQTFAGGNDPSYAPKNDGSIKFGYFRGE